LKAKLTDLGFIKNTISETIVSTYNPDGTPNAAPMGIIPQDEEHVNIIFFGDTQTRQNIAATKSAVINLTNNIELFYQTCFKDPHRKLPADWFKTTQTCPAPRLQAADAAIEVTLLNLEPLVQAKTKATLKIENIAAPTQFPKVYCRAMALTLEAIIHATRVQAYQNNPLKQQDTQKLLNLIEHSKETVQRIAPGTVYSLVMADLSEKIKSWRHRTP
jgi:hypothetical protein